MRRLPRWAACLTACAFPLALLHTPDLNATQDACTTAYLTAWPDAHIQTVWRHCWLNDTPPPGRACTDH